MEYTDDHLDEFDSCIEEGDEEEEEEEDFSKYEESQYLETLGYKVVDVGYGVWMKVPSVFFVKKIISEELLVAKYYTQEKRGKTWERMKEIYKQLDELNIGPKIHHFDDDKQICFMEAGVYTFDNLLKDKKADERVKKIIEVLHKNHFIHGDIHAGNIMMRKDGTVFFIDLDQTVNYDIDDLKQIKERYDLEDINEIIKYEKKGYRDQMC